MSAAVAYIHSNGVSSRDNLDILLSTTVTRILFKPSSRASAQPIVSGVEFAQSSDGMVFDCASLLSYKTHVSTGPRYQAFVEKEVIVSGGTINTPLLLMLSGIGDKEELTPLGIDTVVNRPAVGKNFQVRNLSI